MDTLIDLCVAFEEPVAGWPLTVAEVPRLRIDSTATVASSVPTAPVGNAVTAGAIVSRAEALAAVFCLFLDRHSTPALSTSPSPPAGMTTAAARDARDERDVATREPQLGRGECGDNAKRCSSNNQAALDEGFSFLLSLLSLGVGQHPLLRSWVWHGIGAVPFSCWDDDREDGAGGTEGTGADSRGANGTLRGRPFTLVGRDAENEEDKEDEGSEPITATNFLCHWAFTALARQERDLLAITSKSPGKAPSSPSLTAQSQSAGDVEDARGGTAIECECCPQQQYLPVICESMASSSTTSACRVYAASSRDTAVVRAADALALVLLQPSAVNARDIPAMRGGALGESGEDEGGCTSGSSANGRTVSSRNDPSCFVRPLELPPLAAAYMLLESPQARRATLFADILPDINACTGGSKIKSSQSCLLAAIPASHGIHAVLDGGRAVEGGESSAHVCAFAVVPHFERELHERFTCILSNCPSSPSPPSQPPPTPSPMFSDVGAADQNSSVLSWYSTVRGSTLYEGAMAAAAAMLGYELQAMACGVVSGNDHTAVSSNREHHEVRMEDKGAGIECGGDDDVQSVPATANTVRLQATGPLALAWRYLMNDSYTNASLIDSRNVGSTDRKEDVNVLSPHAIACCGSKRWQRCGHVWTALLATLTLSDGAPGQYVRSVLEPSSASVKCKDQHARHEGCEGNCSRTKRQCGVQYDEMVNGGTEKSVEEEETLGVLGFAPELFLPTLDELEDYGKDRTPDHVYASLLHADPRRALVSAIKPEDPRPLLTIRERVEDEVSGCVLASTASLVAVALRHPRSERFLLNELTHVLVAMATDPTPDKWGDELSQRLTTLFSVCAYSSGVGLAAPPLPKPKPQSHFNSCSMPHTKQSNGDAITMRAVAASEPGWVLTEDGTAVPPVQVTETETLKVEPTSTTTADAPSAGLRLRLRLGGRKEGDVLAPEPAPTTTTRASATATTVKAASAIEGMGERKTDSHEEDEEISLLLGTATPTVADASRAEPSRAQNPVTHVAERLDGGGKAIVTKADASKEVVAHARTRTVAPPSLPPAPTFRISTVHAPQRMIHAWSGMADDAVGLYSANTGSATTVDAVQQVLPVLKRTREGDDDSGDSDTGRTRTSDEALHRASIHNERPAIPLLKAVTAALRAFAIQLFARASMSTGGTPPASSSLLASYGGDMSAIPTIPPPPRRALPLAVPPHIRAFHTLMTAATAFSVHTPEACAGAEAVRLFGELATRVLYHFLNVKDNTNAHSSRNAGMHSAAVRVRVAQAVAVLQPFARSRYFRDCDRDRSRDSSTTTTSTTASLFFSPTLSPRRLPQLLVQLQQEETDTLETERRQAQEAKAGQRHRLLIALSGRAKVFKDGGVSHTEGSGSSGGGSGATVKDVQRLLTQLGMVEPGAATLPR